MAKSKKKAKKAKVGAFSAEVEQLVNHLQSRQDADSLCDHGQERLIWWRENGHKFKTIREAIGTWDQSDIEAYLDYIGFYFNDPEPPGAQIEAEDSLGIVADFVYLLEAMGDDLRAEVGLTKKFLKQIVKFQERLIKASEVLEADDPFSSKKALLAAIDREEAEGNSSLTNGLY